jgi:hypothetical protein
MNINITSRSGASFLGKVRETWPNTNFCFSSGVKLKRCWWKGKPLIPGSRRCSRAPPRAVILQSRTPVRSIAMSCCGSKVHRFSRPLQVHTSNRLFKPISTSLTKTPPEGSLRFVTFYRLDHKILETQNDLSSTGSHFQHSTIHYPTTHSNRNYVQDLLYL